MCVFGVFGEVCLTQSQRYQVVRLPRFVPSGAPDNRPVYPLVDGLPMKIRYVFQGFGFSRDFMWSIPRGKKATKTRNT